MKRAIILMTVCGMICGLAWRLLQTYHFYDLLFLRALMGNISMLCIDISFIALIFLAMNSEGGVVSKKRIIKDIVIWFIVVMLFITLDDLIPYMQCDGAGNCHKLYRVTMIDILKERQ